MFVLPPSRATAVIVWSCRLGAASTEEAPAHSARFFWLSVVGRVPRFCARFVRVFALRGAASSLLLRFASAHHTSHGRDAPPRDTSAFTTAHTMPRLTLPVVRCRLPIGKETMNRRASVRR